MIIFVSTNLQTNSNFCDYHYFVFSGEIKRNSVLLQQNIDDSREEVMGTNKNGYDIQLYSSPASVSQPVNSG